MVLKSAERTFGTSSLTLTNKCAQMALKVLKELEQV
jgi:hypothetical protein